MHFSISDSYSLTSSVIDPKTQIPRSPTRRKHASPWRDRECRTPKDAFTLIELIVVVAVSGIVMAALAFGLYEGAQSLNREKALRTAILLADDLMREIRTKNYVDPQTGGGFGPEESTPRANFDDVDDYDDWSNSPPVTIEGVAMTAYNDFTRSVIVVNVSPDNLDTGTPEPDGSTQFKRITVSIARGNLVTTIVKGKDVILASPETLISSVSVVSEHDK